MSVRILKVSSAVLEMDYSTFALKKGSTPDPSQLLRGQDPAQYPIIILMETIKDLYAGASLSLDQLRAFVEVVETRAISDSRPVSMGPESETGSRNFRR
jgi:hypothetical protein